MALGTKDSGRGKLRPDGTRRFESLQAYRNRCVARRLRSKEDPRKVRNWNLLRAYGITVDHFDAIAAEQKGQCLICGKVPGRLFVDHCHETKKVRGLLCSNCNTVLGMVNESRKVLASMIGFIDWWKAGEKKAKA